MPPRYVAQRRQIITNTALPAGTGIVNGALTLSASNVASNSLINDASATGANIQFTASTTFRFTASATGAPTPMTSGAGNSATTSGASSSPLSVGAVVGICVGVFVCLCAALGLVLRLGSRKRLEKKYGAGTLGSRNGKQDTERRKSGRELWVRMEDASGEKFSMKQTASNERGGSSPSVISRSITVKSSKTFKSIGYGAGLGLTETFRTPDVPHHLEFTDPEMGMGTSFSRGIPIALAQSENMPVSWGGGGTAVAENRSILSLKHSTIQDSSVMKDDVAPSSVPRFQTPPAVETKLHQWETAEVVSPQSARTSNNVFANDNTSSQASHLTEPSDGISDIVTSRFSEDTVRQSDLPNPFQDQNPFSEATSSNGLRADTMEAARSLSALSHASTAYYSAHTAQPDGDDAYAIDSRPGAAVLPTAAPHGHAQSSTDRAMAQLLAALNISPEEARSRISAASKPTVRASMQSSLSGLSYYSQQTTSDSVSTINEERYRSFPLPPTNTVNSKYQAR